MAPAPAQSAGSACRFPRTPRARTSHESESGLGWFGSQSFPLRFIPDVGLSNWRLGRLLIRLHGLGRSVLFNIVGVGISEIRRRSLGARSIFATSALATFQNFDGSEHARDNLLTGNCQLWVRQCLHSCPVHRDGSAILVVRIPM